MHLQLTTQQQMKLQMKQEANKSLKQKLLAKQTAKALEEKQAIQDRSPPKTIEEIDISVS